MTVSDQEKTGFNFVFDDSGSGIVSLLQDVNHFLAKDSYVARMLGSYEDKIPKSDSMDVFWCRALTTCDPIKVIDGFLV